MEHIVAGLSSSDDPSYINETWVNVKSQWIHGVHDEWWGESLNHTCNVYRIRGCPPQDRIHIYVSSIVTRVPEIHRKREKFGIFPRHLWYDYGDVEDLVSCHHGVDDDDCDVSGKSMKRPSFSMKLSHTHTRWSEYCRWEVLILSVRGDSSGWLFWIYVK